MAQGWIRSYHNASTGELYGARPVGWLHFLIDLSNIADLSEYEGKRVLFLGRGNAAFEFANAVLEVAASVTMLGRSTGRLRLAYETHYPVRRAAVWCRVQV